MVGLQSGALGECGVHLHCHYFQKMTYIGYKFNKTFKIKKILVKINVWYKSCNVCLHKRQLQPSLFVFFMLVFNFWCFNFQCSAIGASFCYLIADFVGHKWVEKYWPTRVADWQAQVSHMYKNILSHSWTYSAQLILHFTPLVYNCIVSKA